MKIWKLLTATAILFLVLGSAAAFEINELKTIDGYNSFDNNGFSNYTTNTDRYFCVEKIAEFDDDFKDEWFTSHADLKYTVNPAGNNIYSVADETFDFYGYQEVVEIDGDYYMVSINQNSKLSPSEETGFLSDLNEFNKLNNLKPVTI